MADDGVGGIFIFVQEVGNARESNLVDVFVNFLSGHSNTLVADGKGTLVGIETYTDGQVAQFSFEVALLFQGLQLLCGIDGIADHLAEEYLMIGIEKLFDDGENVLCRNPDVTFLHDYICYF